VLRAQRGVLGRLGNPPDPDLALARQRPVGEPDRAPNLNQAAKHLGVRKAALTRQVDHLEQAVGATSWKPRLTLAGAMPLPVVTAAGRPGCLRSTRFIRHSLPGGEQGFLVVMDTSVARM
jgi:hypothetical protein